MKMGFALSAAAVDDDVRQSLTVESNKHGKGLSSAKWVFLCWVERQRNMSLMLAIFGQFLGNVVNREGGEGGRIKL